MMVFDYFKPILRSRSGWRSVLIGVLLLCGGCAETSNVSWRMITEAWRGPAPIDSSKLDARFRYLRITMNQGQMVMVLGEVESHSAGPVEFWFSGSREVLRLQQGRVAGLTGVYVEWPWVQWPGGAPDWAAVLARSEAIEYERLRDVMPGYRYGVRDRLQLRPIAAPSRSALTGVAPQSLRWFEEVMLSTTDHEPLPPARYALALEGGVPQVVYAEQCIAITFCFTWQRWAAGQ